MALTDAKIKHLCIPEGKKMLKVSDSGGLNIVVKPSGKYWHLSYRFAGKQKTLAIGVYPAVSLREARTARDKAKELLRQNIDPSQNKQKEKRQAIAKARAATFEGVAVEWLEKQATTWSSGYLKDTTNRLKQNVFPWLGRVKIAEIEVPELLATLQRIENRGAIETAHKVRSICSQVFRYAIMTGRVKSDPIRDLKGALTPVNINHRAAITEPKKAGELMRAIQGFQGSFVVHCALKVSPYVFVRPVELRKAEWVEIDLEAKQWKIPADKMKMKEIHIVPLSSQVLAILEDIKPLTGHGRYVFPSIRTMDCLKSQKPMSDGTINTALRRLGFGKDEMCAHGFRGMASTLLHEQGFNSDIIERQLAHKEGNAIKAAYNHARHLPERTDMMQHWANYLDALRGGAKVIPIGKRA
ncbi:MAG: tyrosine-type recombinase/integrase [Mariprofundaceae bacterium]|nr:tyrosine-type recombinase/integrase [Mariprofundaceae bacterium]